MRIENLSFKYNNDKVILDDINYEFEKGKLYAIKGESGTGKSTLLTILAGLDAGYTGSLFLNEIEIKKNKLKKYNHDNISIVFQNLNLLTYLNVYDNINQGSAIKTGKNLTKDEVSKYLDKFNLDIKLTDMPGKLSGGQQQRVAILRALLSGGNVILADEPTAAVDNKNSLVILNELREIARDYNKIVIIVTHDLEVVKRCDEKLELSYGKLV